MRFATSLLFSLLATFRTTFSREEWPERLFGGTDSPLNLQVSGNVSQICPDGSSECAAYCCVGRSCCRFGSTPCCLPGATCQVFDNNAPLCCVQGINCGSVTTSSTSRVSSTPPSPPTTPPPPPPPTASLPISSSSSSTMQTTSASQTLSPSTTNSSSPTTGAGSKGNGLAASDKIALGLGIAVGVPSALASIIQMIKWMRR